MSVKKKSPLSTIFGIIVLVLVIGVLYYGLVLCTQAGPAAQKAAEMDTFRLCITPEGTRKPTAEWKRGFYYIALKANLPILLYGLDYERKLVKCTRTFLPTGNVEKDMAEIKTYFKEFTGRHPEKFKI